jgi:hypothetical protein
MPRTTITTDIQTLVNGLYMVVVVVTGILAFNKKYTINWKKICD